MHRGKRSSKIQMDEMNPEDLNDDVDSFHAQRDIIRFGDVPAEDEADDDIQDEHVMGIDAEEEEEDGMEEGVVYDIGSRGDDVDHYYDEDDVQVATSKRETRGGWGKTKQIYYEHQRKQPTEQTEEAAEEIEEALRLQKEHAAELRLEDFDDSMGALLRKQLPTKKSADSSLLEALNTELEDIPTSGSVIEKDIEKLSNEQKLQAISAESPELIPLINEFRECIDAIINTWCPLANKASTATPSLLTNFIRLKYSLLLQYCMNLAFYFSLKAKGEKVRDHPVIACIAKLRDTLAQTDPLEKQLSPFFNNPEVLQEKLKQKELQQRIQDSANPDSQKARKRRAKRKAAKQKRAAKVREESLDDFEDELPENDEPVKAVAPRKRASFPGLEDFEDSDEEDAGPKRALLSQAINSISQSQSKKARSADQDVPRPQPRLDQAQEDLGRKRLRKEMEEPEENEETPLKATALEQPQPESEEDANGKRSIDKKIEKNRGLTRPRTKKAKTSHTKLRGKYKDKTMRLHGAKPKMRDKTKPYMGEETGIKSSVVKSIHLA